MKKLLFIVTLGLLAGCEKLDELTKFNLDYQSSVTIPSSTGISLPFNIATPPITTNSQSTFQSNNTRADLVESISISEMKLTLTAPQGADFSFLSSVYIYISADGLPETLIASLDPVAGDANQVIYLDLEDVNLKDFVIKDQFSLKVTSTTDETLLQDHTIDIDTRFLVNAKVLGI